MLVGISGPELGCSVAVGTLGSGVRTFGRLGVDVDAFGLEAPSRRFVCGVPGNPPGPRRGVPFIAPGGRAGSTRAWSWVGRERRARRRKEGWWVQGGGERAEDGEDLGREAYFW